jgi:glycosyltransferase involved in cell wall biosynthesis
MASVKRDSRKNVFINGRFLTQPITGIQRYAREIVTRLVAAEPNRFWIMVPRNTVSIPEVLRARVMPIGRFQGHFWEQFELGPYVELRGGLLYSPTMTNPLMVSKQFVTIQDIFVLEHREWVGWQFHRWYSWLLPRLIRKSQIVLSGSEFTKSDLVRKFALLAASIQVIPCGVDPRFEPVSMLEQDRIREKYRLPDQFFLSLGSIEPRKNVAALIAAWSLLPIESRWPLLIAGKVGATEVFGRVDAGTTASNSNGIRMLGYVPDEDLPGLYTCASVFAYPSLLEGFGLPPLEAAMCGTRVVTSNNSGMLEVMTGSAVLVDPLSIEFIADGMKVAMTTPGPSDLQRQALRNRYDWDKSAKLLLEVLLK